MPTVFTHAVVGLGAAHLFDAPREHRARFLLYASLAPVVPDADASFMRWIPYGHMFGHRGFSHSFVGAALIGLGLALVLWQCRKWFPGGFWGLAGFLAALAATNGVFDAMTDGGMGVAFFAPFSNARHFFPWRPVPVSPIGLRGALTAYFAEVMAAEVLLFWTLSLAGVFWHHRIKPGYRAVAAAIGVVAVFSWMYRLIETA